MGPADALAMTEAVESSPLKSKYAAAIDRESAREKLAARLEAGAAAAREEKAPAGTADDHIGYPTGTGRTTGRKAPAPSKQDGSVVQDIMKSPAARDLMRTAAREIVRGVFGVGRRR